ncbi:unnamed protein product [Nezara viridula]|uniref:Uncharacterized protein n=1 Tax=Nezara viridula TaxID=85310 RepID=A0A9P0MPA3_NEZVI|nr:unnamed protein product [Nezara viridula]
MKHYEAILLLFYVTSGSSRFLNDSVSFDNNSNKSNEEIMAHQSEYIIKPVVSIRMNKCTRTLCCPWQLRCGTHYSCYDHKSDILDMIPCLGNQTILNITRTV